MDRKKAQMEIIGLVVIVILISLGMLFLVQFALQEKPDSGSFTRKGLAFSTMSTLMKTTVDCPDEEKSLSMRELLAECAEDQGASAPFTRKCDQQDSCEKFKMLSEDLLQMTLGSWGKRYEFTASLPQTGREETFSLSIAEGACAGRDRDTSGSFAHPTDIGTVTSILYVC